MMRRALAVFPILVVAVAGLAAGTAAWVLYTSDGLTWAVSQVERASGGAVALEHESGTLAGGAIFSRIHYETPPVAVDARRVQIRLSPLSVLRFAPRIITLHAARLHLDIRAGDEPARPPEVPALPVSLRVDDARVGKFVITRAGESTELDAVSLGYEAAPTVHRLRSVRFRLNEFDIGLDGTVGTGTPFPVTAEATVAREAPGPRLAAHISVQGDLQRLALDATAESAGAGLRADAEIAPGTDHPITRLNATLTGLDLHALEKTLPQTALSGALELAAAGGGSLTGTVHLSNAMTGPYDEERLPLAELRSAIRTDFVAAELSDLVIDLGTAGALSGSAHIQPEKLTLSLTTRNLDLRGLHGRMRDTQLAGKTHAVLARDRQSVTADFTQGDMRLRFRAERADDVVELHEAVAHARGGEAHAQGRLTLDDRQPFTAQVRFKGFDPAAWGDFPPGSISGKLNSQGTLEGPRAKIEFALGKSRLRDAPLAGAGRFSVTGQRLSAADFELRLGANGVKVSGAFGGRDDILRLRVDAPHLATLDPRLAGRIKGEARLSGTPASPQARFEASAKTFKAANVSIGQVTIHGAYGADPAAPLHLTAKAAELLLDGKRVAALNIQLDGSQTAHIAAITATGEGFDLHARARGGWQAERKTWSGALLEFVNHGALEAALESPGALTAAPDKIVVSRFNLRVLDGRLEVGESRYEEGRLSTKGRFTRLPVGALAAATGAMPGLGGTLRVSGAWSIAQEKMLAGSFTVRRESGDITLGPEGTFPLQLKSLALDGHLRAQQIEFRAALESALATGQMEGAIGMVATDQGAGITSGSPLRFTARLAIARLSAVTPLFDANLLVDGRLDAALTGRGTVGAPVVTGDITGERLAVALPPQGIDLKGGSLRAALTERALRVERLSIRGGEGALNARGNLVFKEGENASIEWQTDRLLLLGRPDRRLVISGKGRAGLAGKKLSLSGGLRADEGYFEIGPDALPEPGDDVIVAGRKPPPKDDSRLSRTHLDLVVDFGSKFQVRGRGLDTRLEGKIAVGTTPEGTLRGKGALRTVRGVYTALGQRLEIERGELLFSGPLDNPGLDILAMRKRQAVEAGVAVTGTLHAPLARIVSEPPVSESEAISWLMLGHGTGDASRGDLAMLPLAASSLLGKEGGPTIAQRFGLDTLGLRGAGTEGQFVTAGKRIADRLYVGFEQSLGAAESILKLEFDLTPRVLLRAQTGDTNAVGVFYRYSFD
ncbi:MAG TPA: translocation/assembly module TamB domain-containing protein [Burkholderiales bacterium]|nr:translocation/assembly module TamB domain-containing protein [Burkholderiales bacterium]